MELRAQTEVAAPMAFVMARVIDFEAHEALARGRGVPVERLPGPSWRVTFEMLGVRRETALQLTSRGPYGLRAMSETAGVAGDWAIVLARIGPERTRLEVSARLAARTLGGRLALGPLRLAQGEVERRLTRGADAFATRTAEAWARERTPGA